MSHSARRCLEPSTYAPTMESYETYQIIRRAKLESSPYLVHLTNLMRKFALTMLAVSSLWAQGDSNHVRWTFAVSATPDGQALGRLNGSIDSGWHLYSITTPPGPIPTTIRLADNPAVQSLMVYQPKPERKFDPNFNADTETYTDKVDSLLKIKLTKPRRVTWTVADAALSGVQRHAMHPADY